ncbi:SRPBCC family protein [Georgenia sp. H159]|uniref:SRPBCC family protein n=1 Tax=Georgenia sp. H159 TaxID=3076115 RepID=UPI002D78F212|nr:SRPBCC family protein [Georgenia sp. H159]
MRPTDRPARVTAPIMLLGGVLAAVVAARRVQQTWGATAEEVRGGLPGDDVLGAADLMATRAVSIAAPPQDVWPWLAQLGQGRGGFYSYDRLQSLLGLYIDNADDVMPEWQDIAPGDVVLLAPEVELAVVLAEPGHALVLHGDPESGSRTAEIGMPFGFTWAFVLRPGPRGTTRLLVRERYTYVRPWARPLVELVQVASFVMTERMLRGIRDRAEARPPAQPVA